MNSHVVSFIPTNSKTVCNHRWTQLRCTSGWILHSSGRNIKYIVVFNHDQEFKQSIKISHAFLYADDTTVIVTCQNLRFMSIKLNKI